jgi:predicted nucleotidyltransferase
MRTRMEVSELRRNLFETVRSLPESGPVDLVRYGHVIARLEAAPAQDGAKPTIEPRRLKRLCQRHHVVKLALFGSILRDDFGPTSDVDVLVELDRPQTLTSYTALHDDLVAAFGRPVDVLTFAQVAKPTPRNLDIQESARVIYEA